MTVNPYNPKPYTSDSRESPGSCADKRENAAACRASAAGRINGSAQLMRSETFLMPSSCPRTCPLVPALPRSLPPQLSLTSLLGAARGVLSASVTETALWLLGVLSCCTVGWEALLCCCMVLSRWALATARSSSASCMASSPRHRSCAHNSLT